MWKIVCDSVQGTSHKASSLVCQDYCRAEAFGAEGDYALLAACADGAGSALYSEKASALVCEGFFRFFQTTPPRDLVDGTSGYGIAELLLAQLRREVDALAAEMAIDVRELACTFLGAVILGSGAAFLQIGDGAIVIRRENEYEPVFWPQSGEYLNTTNFVTDADFLDKVAIRIVRDCVDEIAMFTDGIERLALRTSDRMAHGPFFRPLFEALRASQEPAALSQPLQLFLDSEAVNERTDDDKTLVLATRFLPALNTDAPVL